MRKANIKFEKKESIYPTFTILPKKYAKILYISHICIYSFIISNTDMLDLTPFLEKYFGNTSEPILVACSTGPDSMYLVHGILATKFKERILLMYFHHHLRPEADKEVQFFQHFCHKYGLPYEIGHADIPALHQELPSVSLEELARRKRYEFFAHMREKYHASYTLTAHHANDRIETFFFNLLRGTKLTGLINMQEKSGNILRPLLSIGKHDIVQFLRSHGLKHMFDSSNTDTRFARNKLRNIIFPKFEHINIAWEWHIGNFIEYAEELQEFLHEQVKNFLAKNDGFFLVRDFAKESEFLQKEILRFVYTQCNGSNIGLTEANLREMHKFVFSPNGGTYFELHTCRLEKKSGKVRWKKI